MPKYLFGVKELRPKPRQGRQIDQSNAISRGLVWSTLFNEQGGNTIVDMTGKHNNGTISGTPLWIPNTAMPQAAGTFFGSGCYAGNANSIALSRKLDGFQATAHPTGCSFAGMVYVPTPAPAETSSTRIFALTDDTNHLILMYWSVSGFRFVVNSAITGIIAESSPQTLPGKVVHLALSFDNVTGLATIYLDGNNSAILQAPSSLIFAGGTSTGALTINPAALYLNTYYVWNRPITAAEAAQMAQDPWAPYLPPKERSLLSTTWGNSAPSTTGYTLTGPATATIAQPSAGFSVTIAPKFSHATAGFTITPSDGGVGGTFSPTSVALATTPRSPGQASIPYNAAFSYTPPAGLASGTVVHISTTNTGGYTNPAALNVTVTYAPLLAGTTVITASGDNYANANNTSTSGGFGTLTFNWYISRTSNFAPAPANRIASFSGNSVVASGLSQGQYFIIATVTDQSVPPQTATALQAPLLINDSPQDCVLGIIGDSIMINPIPNNDPPSIWVSRFLQVLYGARVLRGFSNGGFSGSATPDWINSTKTPYNNAVFVGPNGYPSFRAAGVTDILCGLGTNDATVFYSTTLSQYIANLKTMVASLFADIPTLRTITFVPPNWVVNGSGAIAGGQNRTFNQTSQGLLQQYAAGCKACADNIKLFAGDNYAYQLVAENPSLYTVDGIHPNVAMSAMDAFIWTVTLARTFGLAPRGLPPPVNDINPIS